MKASEIKLTKDNYLFNTKSYSPGSHYKYLMRIGRLLPSSKAQAKYFLSSGSIPDVLNFDDVENIESILAKIGVVGSYKYTKSKSWVRLQNTSDLRKAIKLNFNI